MRISVLFQIAEIVSGSLCILMAIVIAAIIPSEEICEDRFARNGGTRCRSAFTLYEGFWTSFWVNFVIF